MSNLIKKVEESNRDDFSCWRFLELAGYGVCLVNVPLGATMALGALVADVVAHHKKLSEERMPDEWLQEVADSQRVSKRGLAHLAKCVQNNGFVSVRDAIRWIEIEGQEDSDKKNGEEKKDLLAAPGAVSLLTRAGRECGNYLDVVSLKRAMEALSSVRELAGVASEASAMVTKAASFLKRI
ncbi:TPA: hypothetical protein I8273_004807 [Aeromonas hydrophila]|nr:hypothetical protein [Aeromonas hydrophila]HAT2639254.1 hypothetical protein [Aeromonas hydrophila]HAT3424503.1 hypothetical protein [Aeromonas hydrophila]HAT3534429.1 hypothetical protein [Aeromonas hydrophila]